MRGGQATQTLGFQEEGQSGWLRFQAEERFPGSGERPGGE